MHVRNQINHARSWVRMPTRCTVKWRHAVRVQHGIDYRGVQAMEPHQRRERLGATHPVSGCRDGVGGEEEAAHRGRTLCQLYRMHQLQGRAPLAVEPANGFRCSCALALR